MVATKIRKLLAEMEASFDSAEEYAREGNRPAAYAEIAVFLATLQALANITYTLSVTELFEGEYLENVEADIHPLRPVVVGEAER